MIYDVIEIGGAKVQIIAEIKERFVLYFSYNTGFTKRLQNALIRVM
jgi:hypothetical protein